MPDTYSKAWRDECLARHVATMEKPARHAFLKGVEKHHGRPRMLDLMRASNEERRRIRLGHTTGDLPL